jgi:UDP-GlcNAc:undecaprenyl-phosphate GlcNAc-1-phosphate transferase
MVRRLVSGRPLFQGDREHIHHMLLARGWSQRHVALVLYGVCATFGLLAAIFTKTSSPTTGFALFVLAVAVLVAVGQLRYHEMDEFKAGVKRNVTDRRIRVANNIRVRRASLAVSKASNLNDLLNSISQMLEFGEFVHAELCLGQAGNAQSNERALQLGPNAHVKGAAMRNGRIAWAWSKGDLDPESVIGSRHCWSVRLPLGSNGTNWGWINLYRDFASEPLLVDINYICDLFRRELSVAVERILRADQTIVNSHTLSMSVSAGKLTN